MVVKNEEACTRKAAIAYGEAILCAGPSGTGFFIFFRSILTLFGPGR